MQKQGTELPLPEGLGPTQTKSAFFDGRYLAASRQKRNARFGTRAADNLPQNRGP